MSAVWVACAMDERCLSSSPAHVEVVALEEARQKRPDTAVSVASVVAALPDHLGWGTADVSRALRRQTRETPTEKEPQPSAEPPRAEAETIAVFGHVLDRLQQQGWEGIGRVWLLLRHLDRQRGEGRVSLRLARYMLTNKRSRYRCLSWKRLRQLLNEGEGILWHRDQARRHVYYHAEARVAKRLGLTAIRGWAVAVPVRELCGSITAVRALFYDAFHSGRGDGFQKPITRHIMSERGNGERRTQRKYEQLRGIKRQSSFATVGLYDKLAWRRAQAEDGEEEAGERIGGPAFIYIDYKGILGNNPHRRKRRAHQRHWHNIYIMRQIGNAYQGTLPTVKRGRMWTNRKLKHLCNSIPATGSFAVEDPPTPDGRLYFGSAEAAQKVWHDEERERPSYWPRCAAQEGSGYWQEEAVPWVGDERYRASEKGASKKNMS